MLRLVSAFWIGNVSVTYFNADFEEGQGVNCRGRGFEADYLPTPATSLMLPSISIR